MAPDSKLLLGLEGAGGQGGAIHCRKAIVAGHCLHGDLSERGMAGDLFPIRAGARVSIREVSTQPPAVGSRSPRRSPCVQSQSILNHSGPTLRPPLVSSEPSREPQLCALGPAMLLACGARFRANAWVARRKSASNRIRQGRRQKCRCTQARPLRRDPKAFEMAPFIAGA